MERTIITQLIKEEKIDWDALSSLYEDIGFFEEPERFTYIVKIERKVSTKKTEIKVSYRDTRIDMDYKIIHESDERKDYKKIVKFFEKNGYNLL